MITHPIRRTKVRWSFDKEQVALLPWVRRKLLSGPDLYRAGYVNIASLRTYQNDDPVLDRWVVWMLAWDDPFVFDIGCPDSGVISPDRVGDPTASLIAGEVYPPLPRNVWPEWALDACRRDYFYRRGHGAVVPYSHLWKPDPTPVEPGVANWTRIAEDLAAGRREIVGGSISGSGYGPVDVRAEIGPAPCHWTYLMSDAAGRLLYVGESNSPARRHREHENDKPWMDEVVEIQWRRHDDKTTALAEQARAIRDLDPLHNKTRYRSWDDPAG